MINVLPVWAKTLLWPTNTISAHSWQTAVTMHLATRSSMGLAQLAILAASSPLPLPLPLRPAHAISVLSYIPEDIVWHQTNLVTVNATNGSPAFPMVGGNVTACTHVTYDEVSPARTSVVREDCADLAEQVKSTPGFWELCNWSDDKSGDFRALVSNGTCEFAVKRRGTPSGFNTSNSDVAM